MTYLHEQNQEAATDEHDDEAVDEPSHPVHAVAHSHHLHDLLQTEFLLQDDVLDGHGDREQPGKHHEEWQGSTQGIQEPGPGNNRGVQKWIWQLCGLRG